MDTNNKTQKTYVVEITIESDTLIGSTGGGALIDSVTTHHQNGMPYIPASTIKGLIKESAIEVAELSDNKEKESADNIVQLFGKEGTEKGKLEFGDAEINKYTSYLNSIQKNDFNKNEVLGYFTHLRHQTAMEGGIAKTGSLRVSQVLKAGNVLKSQITGEITKREKNHLLKACRNLTRIGTNRNRGFGKVRIRLLEDKNQKENQKEEIYESDTFKLTLTTPALLPEAQADTNIVGSSRVISGRKIIGMLAGLYKKNNNSSTKLEEDSIFCDLFLNGKVKFSDAYPVGKNDACFPLGLHWVTTKAKNEVHNDFTVNNEVKADKKTAANLKPIGGFHNQNGTEKARITATLDFHNSRNKVNQSKNDGRNSRVTGSNQGDGIYYYEKLSEGQSFAFTISGDEEDKKKIRRLLSDAHLLRLGKASSKNLGRIKIESLDTDIFKYDYENAAMVTFVSPVLLRDAGNGEYIPSTKNLAAYLGFDIEAHNTRLRSTNVQVYQSKINMQLPEMRAIAPGSSLYVSKDQLQMMSKLNGSIGEHTHEGYGRYIIEEANEGTKEQNLLDLLANAATTHDEGGNTDIAEKDQLPKGNRDFEKAIKLSKKIIQCRVLGIEDAGDKPFHRASTMMMLKVCKELILSDKIEKAEREKAKKATPKVERQNKGKEELIKGALNRVLDKTNLSKKMMENLGGIVNFKVEGENDDGQKLKRKQDQYALLKMIIESKKLETNELSCIAEYWLSRFNMHKINNRNDK